MNTSVKKYGLAALILVSAIAITALLVSMASATPQPVAHSIIGQVSLPTTPGSLLLPLEPGTKVWLLKPDRAVYGWAFPDLVSGTFAFDGVPAGNYLIRATPPDASDLAPSFIQPVPFVSGLLDVGTLYLTTPTITGTVYKPGGNIPTLAWVHVRAGNVQVEQRMTRNDGTFTLGGLWPGTYELVAEPLENEWLWWSSGVNHTIVLSETHYVTLTLQMPQVFGVIEDAGHTPISEATVRVSAAAVAIQQSDISGWPSGRYAIDGLPNGPAVIRVEPPIDRSGLLPLTRSVTLPNLTPLTLTLMSSPKVVTGFVTTNVGTPVENALIVANRVGAFGWDGAFSNAAGFYRFNLAPGLWALTVKPISTTNPSQWIYPLPPQLIHFDDDLLPEGKRLDFKVLTADATVTGLVEMPDHSAPPFTVTVGLHTDEGIGVKQDIDAKGHFTFTVPHGTYNVDVRVFHPQFAALPVDPVYAAPLATTVIPTITLVKRDAAITGTLTVSGTSTPVGGVPVIAWNPTANAAFQARSYSDGTYIVAVYSGTWMVRPAPLPDQPYLYTGKADQVQVATGQVAPNHNFGLLSADSTIHGVLANPDGSLATDAHGWGKAAQIADPAIRNGATVQDGEFDILVPGSATYSVTLRLADGSRYLYTGGPRAATLGLNGTQTLTFPLSIKNAKITGFLRDVRTDNGRSRRAGQGLGLE